MKTKEEVISDLQELLVLVNDGKEGYLSASEATETQELKAFLSQISGERIVYASELKEHIALHGGDPENNNDGVLGGLHRAWLNVKQVFSGNDDKAILNAVTTGERAAIEKYDELIADHADHADHMKLLTEQRDGVVNALRHVEQKIVQA
ncbi:PA2169 family four-helix-bundle protein [Mucilaginibacter myungsuensis]|uniref:PA2169 family four-helix-bundle protein n=1 Tax=Mucilaginibacter myungsuensis TaxID=649104 RepID=A0A929PVT7_9SPHI|nr:PA2169 family four-helix-bundle protein [Mucilaginibacter myungsuensis]